MKLRTEAGYLKIKDDSLFQGIEIPCEEPLTWKWRVFLPKGSKYSWHYLAGMIPASPHVPKCSGSHEGHSRSNGVEAIITVSLRKAPDPQKEQWSLGLSFRSVEAREKWSMRTSVSDQDLQLGHTNIEVFGGSQAVTCKRGETIFLLRNRALEQTSSNSWVDSQKPQPGIAVWLEEIK
ncbi:MAG: hypothetical protein JXB10_18360 [Pirellulales bacterium]|nr:hypothetical protein [Pirellulales bacterium]